MTEKIPEQPARRKKKAFLIAGAVTLAGLLALLGYRAYSSTHITTDDAFVEGSIHIVAARVGGTIAGLPAMDNQAVKREALLVQLDPEPFLQAVQEAEATLRTEQNRSVELEALAAVQEKRLAAAKASLLATRDREEQLSAALSARKAEVRAREAALAQARLDLARAEVLVEKEVIPLSRLDRARTTVRMEAAALDAAVDLARQASSALKAHGSSIAQAEAGLKAEEAAVAQSRASLRTQGEQILRRQAQVEMARLQLGYTEVKAPADGFVTRMSAEVGNTVSPGQPLMSLVSLEEAFVVANYKETRVGRILPGQKTVIKIDALPGRKFTGRVDSVMAGTGSAFTLFPPENASGNYVKVVQRVPVKITFDDLEEVRPFLRVGISVVPTILTEDR